MELLGQRVSTYECLINTVKNQKSMPIIMLSSILHSQLNISFIPIINSEALWVW